MPTQQEPSLPAGFARRVELGLGFGFGVFAGVILATLFTIVVSYCA